MVEQDWSGTILIYVPGTLLFGCTGLCWWLIWSPVGPRHLIGWVTLGFPWIPGNPVPQINTLRPRQNGRHFKAAIFKCIFLNENVILSIEISLKFVPKGPINNIPALFQIMAWHQPGDKPLSEPMIARLLTHICVTRPQCVNSGLIGILRWRLAPLELAGCTNIRTWLTLFRIYFGLIQLYMLYGCILYGPIYYVFVYIMSCQLSTMEIQYIHNRTSVSISFIANPPLIQTW